MKKNFIVSIMLMTVLLIMACGISLDGISFGDEPEPNDPIRDLFLQETMGDMFTEETGPASADATPEPEYQSGFPPGSDMERVVAGSHEYSVSATNFECTCQVTDKMTVDFNFTGNQVEIKNGGGGAAMVYDKIGTNKYQRSFMGFYILPSGEGAQATETKVEEEQHVLITLSNNGYVMENFKGSSSSPCCYYTFTIEK